MNKFISCDWGTTSLRFRIVENERQRILAEITSQQGIAATYALWKNSSLERFIFFRNILSDNIEKLSSQCIYSLNNIPIPFNVRSHCSFSVFTRMNISLIENEFIL